MSWIPVFHALGALLFVVEGKQETSELRLLQQGNQLADDISDDSVGFGEVILKLVRVRWLMGHLLALLAFHTH